MHFCFICYFTELSAKLVVSPVTYIKEGWFPCSHDISQWIVYVLQHTGEEEAGNFKNPCFALMKGIFRYLLLLERYHQLGFIVLLLIQYIRTDRKSGYRQPDHPVCSGLSAIIAASCFTGQDFFAYPCSIINRPMRFSPASNGKPFWPESESGFLLVKFGCSI